MVTPDSLNVKWLRAPFTHHDFGPVRLGTILHRLADGSWQHLLPARHRLRLFNPLGMLLETDQGWRDPGVGALPILPRRIDYLAVSADLDLSRLARLLSVYPYRFGTIDLSALSPDTDVRPLATLGGSSRTARARALILPRGLPPDLASQVLRALHAGLLLDVPPRILPATRPADPAILRAAVAQYIDDHREIVAVNDSESALSLARIYLDAGRAGEALAVLGPALASDSAPAHLVAADALWRLNARLAAIASCEMAQRSSAYTAQALARRADMLRMMGLRAPATLVAEEAMRIEPTSSHALAVLGFSYSELVQVPAAESVQRTLSALDPNGRDALVLVGLIASAKLRTNSFSLVPRFHRLGLRNARSAWQAVLAAYPTDQTGLAQLARIQRRLSPLRRDWVDTQLLAVDEHGPSSPSNRTLADLVLEHPRKFAAFGAGATGLTWFLLAGNGSLPPVSVGGPMLAAGSVGAATFALFRRAIPLRARQASKVLNRGVSRVWAGYAVLSLVGLGLLLGGIALVKPADRCPDYRGRCRFGPPPTIASNAPFSYRPGPSITAFTPGPIPSVPRVVSPGE